MAPRSTHAEPPIPTILRQMAVVSTLYEELLYSFQVCIHYRRTKTNVSHMNFRMALQLERWVLVADRIAAATDVDGTEYRCRGFWSSSRSLSLDLLKLLLSLPHCT